MFSVGLGIWQEYWITWKLRKGHYKDMEYGMKTEIGGKWETHTPGLWIWRENWPTRKMRNSHGRICYMARNTEKQAKWEVFIVGPGIWWNKWKMIYNEKLTQ